MNRVRIKICGIREPAHAECAAEAGADAIGLVFHPSSPRAVDVAGARRVCAVVPAFVNRVGLFVNAPAAEVTRVLADVPLDTLQFHGDESAEFCAGFGRPWIKALRMAPELDPAAAAAPYLAAGACGILLDAWDREHYGGSGSSFDWRRAAAGRDWPLILAGGLVPDNVADAIAIVRPHAVDVSSGVELSPGNKDAGLIRAFCQQVTGKVNE